MADILTQLQTCLDQLATQFYATLCYLTTYHDNIPALPPPNNPDAAPPLAKIPKTSTAPPVPATAPVNAQEQVTGVPAQQEDGQKHGQQQSQQQQNQQQQQQQQQQQEANQANQNPEPIDDPTIPPEPDSPRTFASRQRELARDLVLKEQQIEYLVSVLPGVGASEVEQEGRIRELEGELRGVEVERGVKMRELRGLRRRLEGVLGAVEVGIYGDRGVVAR